MSLITISGLSLIPDSTGKPIVSFLVTIPKNSYFEKFCISYSKDIKVLADVTNAVNDVIETSVTDGTYKVEDWMDVAFTKLYEQDNLVTYQVKQDFPWYTPNNNGIGIEVKDNELVFITLKLDVLTEATYLSTCTDSTLTFAVYDNAKIMSDIVKYGRSLGDGCSPCKDVSDALIQKIVEYRAFNAALNTQDWVLAKDLYNGVYTNNSGGTQISYSLTSKCGCNG